MTKINTKQLTEAGIFISISLVLDFVARFIPLQIWPQGGNVNITLLPIVLFSVRNVTKDGGLLLSILAGALARGMVMLWATVYHPLSAVLDLVVVGALYGAVGIVNKVKLNNFAPLAIVVFGLIALFSHIVSGVVIFYVFMPDVFLGIEMNNFWVYSTLYNCTHAIPTIALTTFLFLLLPKRIRSNSLTNRY
jgi:thiamine transporter